MTTQRPELDGDGDANDALREAIVAAVRRAPKPHGWTDVEHRIAPADGAGSRWALLVSVAAVLVLAVIGGLFALTRPKSQTVRTDNPVVTTLPVATTEPVVPATSAPAVATVSAPAPTPPTGAGELAAVSLPMLPDTVTRAWSTTIEGGYPIAAVRIGETIVFGQQDLPGVRAVDARSGEALWSFTLDDPDPDVTIVDLRVIGDHVILSWMDANATQIVSALNTAGVEVWSAAPASAASGAVLRSNFENGANRLELLATDGSVQREIDSSVGAPAPEGQLAIDQVDGRTWYRLPDLERIAGPITFPTQPDQAVATVDGIISLEDTRLRFLDHTGTLRSELTLELAGTLHPVQGERPGVVVFVADNAQPNVGGRQDGTTTFYELVDDLITPVWTRTGVFEALIELDGRPFVVNTEPTIGSLVDTVQLLIDAATGDTVVFNDLYDSDGAANGFVFAQLDNGAEDVQTVAYDWDGQEKWRLQLDGRERSEIVDRGVLVARPDTVAKTVDLTFYD